MQRHNIKFLSWKYIEILIFSNSNFLINWCIFLLGWTDIFACSIIFYSIPAELVQKCRIENEWSLNSSPEVLCQYNLLSFRITQMVEEKKIISVSLKNIFYIEATETGLKRRVYITLGPWFQLFLIYKRNLNTSAWELSSVINILNAFLFIICLLLHKIRHL